MPNQEDKCTGNNFPSALECKGPLRIDCNEKSQLQKQLLVQEGRGIWNAWVRHTKLLSLRKTFMATCMACGKSQSQSGSSTSIPSSSSLVFKPPALSQQHEREVEM